MRRLIIGVLVLVGLLVAADFGSAALAESAVSRQMREQIGLADDPSVRINGFPFLTQAIAGEYSSIDVDATGIHAGALQELKVNAQLHDVTAPLSMLLGSGPKTIKVGEADGTVRVTADDVERLLPGITDLRIENLDEKALQQAVEDGADPSVADLDPEQVARFGGTATVLGKKVPITVITVLQLTDGQVQIAPRDVHIGDADAPALPAAVQRPIQQLFTLRINPGTLPLNVTPTSLQAQNGELEITGTTSDLELGATTTAP